ncbi:hypothetical protein TW95_gp0256 [Pandoravirus inopinatum]|uniref:Guanylate cyclase domain-containing protein n=1 Tax=Pandoravirus inopinatum TaxID=1605721 RepID=A0A0B5J5N8_9VIRU|nr:hypothetical protein TW95_gp0256 [Pandoravirus inopinatum]AJF96990.1 hypothetical protein [Pandoravirus inopinatum]
MPPTFVDFERLVVDCWNRDPMMRPAFLEAMTRLSTIIDGDTSSSAGGRYTGTSSSSSSMASSSSYAGSSGGGGGGAQADTDEPSLLADSVRGFDRSSPAATPITVHVGHKRAPVADDQGPVTVVFTDVHRADTLWDEIPRAMKDALVEHNLTVRTAVAAHGGYESPFGADRPAGEGTFCLVFARADAALDFCRTAQTALLDAEWPPHLLHHADACEETGGNADDAVVFRGLRVRMAVHTGRVRATMDPLTRRYTYTGPGVDGGGRVGLRRQGVACSCRSTRVAPRMLVGSSPPSPASPSSSTGADIDTGSNSDGAMGALSLVGWRRRPWPCAAVVQQRRPANSTLSRRHFGGAHLGPDADHDRGDDNYSRWRPAFHRRTTTTTTTATSNSIATRRARRTRVPCFGHVERVAVVLDYEEIVVGEQIAPAPMASSIGASGRASTWPSNALSSSVSTRPAHRLSRRGGRPV